jgi:2'-5' RNA ligase
VSYAVSIRSDNASSLPFHRLWDEAARFESRPSMRSLNYGPHITFGVYDRISLAEIDNFLREKSKEKSIELLFEDIRYFNTSPLVLWMPPLPIHHLLQIHSSLHDRIDPSICHEYYRPGRWVPHCTIAFEVLERNRDRAISFAGCPIAPFTSVFDVVDLVRYHPLKVLLEYRLRPL